MMYDDKLPKDYPEERHSVYVIAKSKEEAIKKAAGVFRAEIGDFFIDDDYVQTIPQHANYPQPTPESFGHYAERLTEKEYVNFLLDHFILAMIRYEQISKEDKDEIVADMNKFLFAQTKLYYELKLDSELIPW